MHKGILSNEDARVNFTAKSRVIEGPEKISYNPPLEHKGLTITKGLSPHGNEEIGQGTTQTRPEKTTQSQQDSPPQRVNNTPAAADASGGPD
jgi:hypothetical protein